MTPDTYAPGDVAYVICGCSMCMCPAIHDGTIAFVLNDGRVLNRFRGEGNRQERMTDVFLTGYTAAVK